MHEKYAGMFEILAKIATNKIIVVYRIDWTIPQPRVQGYLLLGDINLRNLVQQELHIPARPGKGKGSSISDAKGEIVASWLPVNFNSSLLSVAVSVNYACVLISDRRLSIGWCWGGATIREVQRGVKSLPSERKLVVMAGLNDVLRVSPSADTA